MNRSHLSRRNFLKFSVAAGLTTQIPHFLSDDSQAVASNGPGLKDGLVLQPGEAGKQTLALVRRYPWLRFGAAPAHGVQIANVHEIPAGTRHTGLPGEAVFEVNGSQLIPWAPMFDRPTGVSEANSVIKKISGAEQLFIKDEGSETAAIYGNKTRKYEFLLPNLTLAGVTKVATHGAFGSNHCAGLALAARYGTYNRNGRRGGMETEFMLYPQAMSENVITKLKLLAAGGSRLRYLSGDAAVALSIQKIRMQTQYGNDSKGAYIEPGGSSPLAVLGHVEAVMELAEQIENHDSPLSSPPDYIFVPMGSGGTAMGLVLGCHLLEWPTKVVATCSQDKGLFARALVNGNIDSPFLVANAAALLDKALSWLDRLGFPIGQMSAAEVLRRGFAYDNVTWLPEYGRVTPEIQRDTRAAAQGGLTLDHTFSAKAFHTLKTYAGNGLLKGRSALFWNTYQRFPFQSLLPGDHDLWTAALPAEIKGQVEAYLRNNGGGVS
jgi:D-cysteine desulfhydrase